MAYAYLIEGCRTPIGRLLGTLSPLTAPELGAAAIGQLLRRAEFSLDLVDEVIMGNVLSAGVGQAPARQAALRAGLPAAVPAVTVNKVCGSGLKAVMLADQAIRCGDARCIVAGGMESMSQAPYLVSGARRGFKFGHQRLTDSMLHDGLWCAFEDTAMGHQADYIARQHAVSRQDQDTFALQSHHRAIAARDDCRAEIVPITVGRGKSATVVDTDEGPRSDTTLEQLARLPAAFDPQGTVTAGNASQISDGAAAVLVVDEATAVASPSPRKFRIVAAAASGVEPRDIFIAPVSAIRRVLDKARMTLADIDLVELNEAFAAQCLACMRPLELAADKTNVRGGAIALGHPIGASGARVLVTLMHALEQTGGERGLAALCLGGGNAVAMMIQRV